MLSFVIINFNGFKFTISCISSILNTCKSSFNYEIIVVDNSPIETEFTHLTEFIFNNKCKNVRLFKLNNKGFGHANNFAIKNSIGDLIFLINNDAELLKFIDINHIKMMFQNTKIGIIAPKVIYPDKLIQPNCSTFINLFSSTLRFLKVGNFFYKNKILAGVIRIIFRNLSKSANTYFDRERSSTHEKFVDWASGCGLIFQKNDFVKYGMFDENFFMYFEDEELCFRFYKMNKRVYYYPAIVISHFVGASSSKLNLKMEIEKVKSELFYYKKHFPWKYNKLRFIYRILSFSLSPFKERFKIISKAFSSKIL